MQSRARGLPTARDAKAPRLDDAFNPGPLHLEAGFPGPDGKTPLYLTATAYIGANVPSIAGSGRVCLRIEQDPAHAGEIDCDGGTNYDVDLVVDSAGLGAIGTPTLTVGTGLGYSGSAGLASTALALPRR